MLSPHPCSDFLKQFLTVRELKQPTGKPLYSYKTSRAEYETLKTLLSTAQPSDSTSACFVLFAAEWWRRNYAGGHWEWEPIFNAINRSNWNVHNWRDPMMTNGCCYWKRSIFRHLDGPNSLLGTLFFESGIPLRLLTNEGYIKDLIIKSFSFLETYRTRPEDTVACIRDLVRSSQLPGSLNVDSFFELIFKVVDAFLQFKTTYQLGNQPQPLAFLNGQLPDWRGQLPLRIDDDPTAGAFLDSLLVDVARLVKQEVSKIGLTHALEQREGMWTIKTQLSIPNGLHTAENLQIDPDAFASFSGRVDLRIVTGTTEQTIGYGYKNGNSQLSISGLNAYSLPANLYAKSWQLVFADSHTDRQASVDLPYGDGLDARLPWVFSQPNEGAKVLKGVGSVRLSAGRAWVVCPTDFVIDGPTGTIINRGAFSVNQTVYEISATCVLRDEADDQLFRIKLSELNEDNFYIALHPQRNGNCINFYQKLNAGIFLGFPRIRKLHKAGGWKVASADTLQYKTARHKTWQTVADTSGLLGRYRIRSVGAEGEVLFSREIAVLPPDFSVCFDAVNRQIMFNQTAGFTLSVYTDGAAISPDITLNGSGHRVWIGAGSQGERLTIRLSAASADDIRLHVPFPAASGVFLDGAGAVMPNNRTIDLHMLYGTSLVLNNVSAMTQTHTLSFTLNDRHNRETSAHTLSKTIRIAPFSNVELSLMKYRADLERLLSFSRGIDGFVRVQHQGSTSICVSQYTHEARYDHPTSLITLKGDKPVDASIRIQAFPLTERFGADSLIDLSCGEAGWSFPAGGDGKWFYFSSRDSAVSLRPSVATRADEVTIDTCETVDELHEATNHSFDNRQTVLIDLFDRMGADFRNVNWNTLQHLHEATKHLPLNALDVWKALIKSNKGLVIFFLRSEWRTIDKLTGEFSVNWHGVPVVDWLEGFRTFQSSLPTSVADLVLAEKLKDMESSFSLDSVAQIIRSELLGSETSVEFQKSQNPSNVGHYLGMVIEGKYGSPGLVQKHDGQQFPTHLNQDLVGGFNRLPGSVRQLVPLIPQHFRYTRPVVYLPVLLAYQSVYPEQLDLSGLNRYQLTQLIDFDEEYFNLVYNLIQAYCWLTLIS